MPINRVCFARAAVCRRHGADSVGNSGQREEEESIVKSAFLACLNTGPNFDVFLQTELAKLDFDKNLVEEIICFTTHSWEMCCHDTRLMLHRILVSRSTVVRNWSEI